MILKLEPNTPYIVALKYPTGKQVTNSFGGEQLRWILSNGDLLYTPLELGAQIEDLGIRPGQKFTLTKQAHGRSFNWIAERTSTFPPANEGPGDTKSQGVYAGNGKVYSQTTGAPGNRPGPQRAATPVQHETQPAHKSPIATILDHSEPLDGIPVGKPVTRLEDALKTAVAAAAAAEKHAEGLGYSCRFTSSDIRAMGISVLISMTQGGRYAA